MVFVHCTPHDVQCLQPIGEPHSSFCRGGLRIIAHIYPLTAPNKFLFDWNAMVICVAGYVWPVLQPSSLSTWRLYRKSMKSCSPSLTGMDIASSY